VFNNNWQVRFLDNTTECFAEGLTPTTFNLPNPAQENQLPLFSCGFLNHYFNG